MKSARSFNKKGAASAEKAAGAYINGETFARNFKKNWQLYLLMLLPLVFYLIFMYVPMAGNIIAFRRYLAGGSIFGSKWSGLRYFEMFWETSDFWRAFRNTLWINVVYLLVRFPLTLLFALLLNEIRHIGWKKIVQTVSYLPHFISMVITVGMIKELLSTSGPVNMLLVSMGKPTIDFIALPDWFVTIFVTSGIWQSLGWGTILYLAAISNINPDLYEAAEVDGAGHFRRVWSITIPCILPTITTLLILDIGQLCSSGGTFEKIFLLYNPMTYETADVLSTYVFRVGIDSGSYSYSTAINLFESLINLSLLTIANFTSKKTTGSGLW